MTSDRLRPLGIAALEDKILGRTLVEVLNGIYETDFLGVLLRVPAGAFTASRVGCVAAEIVDKNVN